MSDLEPSTCTATLFPVSTTTIIPTGEFVVEVHFIRLTYGKEIAYFSFRLIGRLATPGCSLQTWA